MVPTDQKVGGSSSSERAQVSGLSSLESAPRCSQHCCQRWHFRLREPCRSRQRRPRGAAPARAFRCSSSRRSRRARVLPWSSWPESRPPSSRRRRIGYIQLPTRSPRTP